MKQAIKRVLLKIKEHNYQAYVVGGYPRDFYLGKESLDVDICTSAKPRELKEIFPKLDISKAKYGSTSLYFNKIHFEITTFRKEFKYHDFRRPSKIEYIDNIKDDLLRRDFTINTLCMDENDKLIDFLGILNDLDNKIIKTIGDANDKLIEDGLRIMRAIRFATVLDFSLDDNLYLAICENGYLLKEISMQRKKEELDKIFASSNYKKGINLLIKTGLFEHLQLNNLDEIELTDDLISLWAQLDVLHLYPFNKQERDIITKVQQMIKNNDYSDYQLYRYGLYVSSLVAKIKRFEMKGIIKRHRQLVIRKKSDINVSPQDLQQFTDEKCGVKKIYFDLEEKIINHQLKNERQAILNYLKIK